MCRVAGDVIEGLLKGVGKDPEDEPLLDVVAGLYSDKTAGGCRAHLQQPGMGGCEREMRGVRALSTQQCEGIEHPAVRLRHLPAQLVAAASPTAQPP